MVRSLIVGATLTATILASLAPATAGVARLDPALHSSATQVLDVQYRRYPGRGGYRGRRGFPVGAGIAAGLLGGALLGAGIAAANQPAYADPAYGGAQQADADEYCASRYRSYDPSSSSYMGNDGARHACP